MLQLMYCEPSNFIFLKKKNYVHCTLSRRLHYISFPTIYVSDLFRAKKEYILHKIYSQENIVNILLLVLRFLTCFSKILASCAKVLVKYFLR